LLIKTEKYFGVTKLSFLPNARQDLLKFKIGFLLDKKAFFVFNSLKEIIYAKHTDKSLLNGCGRLGIKVGFIELNPLLSLIS